MTFQPHQIEDMTLKPTAVTQADIDNGPHAGLGTVPSDYAPAPPKILTEAEVLQLIERADGSEHSDGEFVRLVESAVLKKLAGAAPAEPVAWIQHLEGYADRLFFIKGCDPRHQEWADGVTYTLLAECGKGPDSKERAGA